MTISWLSGPIASAAIRHAHSTITSDDPLSALILGFTREGACRAGIVISPQVNTSRIGENFSEGGLTTQLNSGRISVKKKTVLDEELSSWLSALLLSSEQPLTLVLEKSLARPGDPILAEDDSVRVQNGRVFHVFGSDEAVADKVLAAIRRTNAGWRFVGIVISRSAVNLPNMHEVSVSEMEVLVVNAFDGESFLVFVRPGVAYSEASKSPQSG